MIALILLFLKSYWKWLVGPLALLLLLWKIYSMGYNKALDEQEIAAARERQNREELAQKETDKTDKIIEQIEKHRTRKPADDKRDSCLLSNDPFSVNCL